MFCTFAHSSLIIWYMLYYIKKYPVSLFIILTVIYLSFFKPPSTEISKIPNIDKVVHICMSVSYTHLTLPTSDLV